MKDFIEGSLGIILAFALYSLLFEISAELVLVINVFTLVLIYLAMKKGEVYGAVYGCLCGMIQDSFSLGVFGVGGISKTVTGYLAGYVSKKLNIVKFFPSLLFLIILLFVDLGLWLLLYFFVFSKKIFIFHGVIFIQPLISAFLGSLVYSLMNKIR